MSLGFPRVLVIGGTGMVGSAITRALRSAGHQVTVGSRRAGPGGAGGQVRFDIRAPGPVRAAAAGADAVVVNLPLSDGRRSGFVAERDGVPLILEGLSNRPDVPVLKLSEIGAGSDPSFFDLEAKAEAARALRASGRPFFALRPTWVIEAWPHQFGGPFGGVLVPRVRTKVHWVSTQDIGTWFAAALAHWDAVEGRTLTAQGPEAIGVEEAGRRFAKATGRRALPLPVGAPRVGGAISPRNRTLFELFRYYGRRDEAFAAGELWQTLGRPAVSFTQFLSRQ